jgi:hypothetical protein
MRRGLWFQFWNGKPIRFLLKIDNFLAVVAVLEAGKSAI